MTWRKPSKPLFGFCAAFEVCDFCAAFEVCGFFKDFFEVLCHTTIGLVIRAARSERRRHDLAVLLGMHFLEKHLYCSGAMQNPRNALNSPQGSNFIAIQVLAARPDGSHEAVCEETS